MDRGNFIWLFVIASGVFTFSAMLQKQRAYLRCLDLKLDALLKAQGVEWPLLSPEVRSLALSGNKIGAIQLHRHEHPEKGLLEAKADVDTLTTKT